MRATLDDRPGASDAFAARMVCIHRYLGSSTAARGLGSAAIDDLAQEAVLRTWANRARYDGSARLETWMIGITRNVLLETLRRRADDRQRRTEFAEGESPADPGAPNPLAAVGLQLELDRVRGAMDNLAEEDRALLDGKLLRGLSFRELSVQFGRPANTLKARYYRLIRSLRRRCGADDSTPERARQT
ncbi:MAG: sigma-70 family RNA polymerase sigma factor [Planctomycetota bacterium]